MNPIIAAIQKHIDNGDPQRFIDYCLDLAADYRARAQNALVRLADEEDRRS